MYSRVVNRARAFRARFRLGLSLGFEKLQDFNRTGRGVKSRFSVSDRVFAIAGITPCINIAGRNWCDCGWVKLVVICIKVSSKFEVMFWISGLNRSQTGR